VVPGLRQEGANVIGALTVVLTVFLAVFLTEVLTEVLTVVPGLRSEGKRARGFKLQLEYELFRAVVMVCPAMYWSEPSTVQPRLPLSPMPPTFSLLHPPPLTSHNIRLHSFLTTSTSTHSHNIHLNTFLTTSTSTHFSQHPPQHISHNNHRPVRMFARYHNIR
jgi:hypothetical protein